MSKIQIVLNGHVDRQTIADALAADGSYIVDVVDNYVTPETIYSLDMNDLGSTSKEAFYKTLDNATHLVEADGLIWKIAQSGKTFNLAQSFIRNRTSTEPSLTALSDGTQLRVRIEIPDFVANEYYEFDLYYNDAFDPDDVDALDAMGITLTGDGAEFTIANLTKCKISFSKPVAATDLYIIDYDKANEIIER